MKIGSNCEILPKEKTRTTHQEQVKNSKKVYFSFSSSQLTIRQDFKP